LIWGIMMKFTGRNIDVAVLAYKGSSLFIRGKEIRAG